MLLEMLCSTGCKDCGSLPISMVFLVFLGFFNDFIQYLHMILDFLIFLGFRNGSAYPQQGCCVKPGVRIMDLYQDLLVPYLYTIPILHILYIIYSVSIWNIGFACALQEVLCYTGCECHGICLCPHVHNQWLLAKPFRKPRKSQTSRIIYKYLGKSLKKQRKTKTSIDITRDAVFNRV